ncbi:hypothetical protein chiPu_0028235 [Chiloscyllium punctatum]|uniref:Uncharacterized protein n=1 Tax=Chiloscyllium punctatum TaxID=137246 RepID=A0A401TN17_CHIPU|nr:hypothetical protein [Chiloscyllium punctatum]
MPLMHVQEGVLDVQEVGTREYNVVKQRLVEAVEVKVEKLSLEVDQRVKEAEEANRVMMTYSRNKEQPKQGRCLAVQEAEARSTPYSPENEKKGRLHDSGQLLDDGFSDRRRRDLREEQDRERLDGEESKSSIDIEDEESLTDDDPNTYPVTWKGSLTMHTEHGPSLKSLPESSYNLRQRDTLRQPIKYQHHQMPLIYRGS